MLEIEFKNANIEKYCTDFRLTKKDFDVQLAKKLSQRMDELRSFDNVYQLLTSGIDNPHLLIQDLEGCIGWDLTSRIRLIINFCSSFDGTEMDKSKTITKVKIEGVRDYHDRNKKWIIN